MPISEVYNMDCMEYMKGIPDHFFDLAIVDPPYGLSDLTKNKNARHRNKRTSYTNKNIPPFEYFQELYRISKRQIIWGCQYMMKHLEEDGSFIVWDKGADPDKHHMSACDIAWYSKRERIRMFRGHWCGAVKFVNETTIHPHQKPIPLYSWILKNYTNPGDKIIDTHLGSGSSRIAAYKMGFDFYATELDKEYFDAQEERFKKECFGEIKTSKGTLVQTSLFGV